VTVAYGVTPAGFVLKPVQQILVEYTADLLSLIDPKTDVSPDQPLGQLLGIGAKKLGEVWQIGQVAYNATNRGDAEGDLLDNIGGLSGTIRASQGPSTVPCAASFSVAGTYVAGALVAYPPASPTAQFANVYPIAVPTIGGDNATGIGVGNPWPSTDPTKPSYGTTFLFASLVDGPAYGNALDAAEVAALGVPQLTSMIPVGGWVSIVDAGGVSLGTLEELDPPYRVRQYQDLSAPGSDTLDATAAAILIALQNAPVPPAAGSSVQMYENTTLATDGNGLPGKSYMAVVYDGANVLIQASDNALIGQAIWNNKPGGIQSYGTQAVTVADSQGVPRTVYFTRPTAVPIFLSFTVAVAASMTGPQRTALVGAIGAALVAASQGQPFPLFGTTFTPQPGAQTTFAPGQDVVASALRAVVQGQPGVVDVPAALFFLGTAAAPTLTANLDFTSTIGELPTLAATAIVVTPVTFTG
jgi:hypothetical protein